MVGFTGKETNYTAGGHCRTGNRAGRAMFRCLTVAALAWLGVLPAALADEGEVSREWVSNQWDVWCPYPESEKVGPCEGYETSAGVFEDYLESASDWYQELGFLGPKVLHKLNRYQANIVHARDARDRDGNPFSGLYHPTEHLIILNGNDFFAMGEPGETTDSTAFRVQESYVYTSVHELFHGIEATYHRNVCAEGNGWICEGMADAALRAYADKFEPEMNIAMKRRPYHEPLNAPSKDEWGYGTWQFWLDVGAYLNSTDRIRYFREVMGRSLTSHNGLVGVDHALKDLMTGNADEEAIRGKAGLYELLPWFFTKHPMTDLFPAPLARTVELAPGENSAERRITNIEVQPVAGRNVELTVKKPADTAAAVKISFAQAHADLHLIVDGQRYDKVEGDKRNVFVKVDDESAEMTFNVIIANVAEVAQTSRETKVTLVVELLTEYASLGHGAAAGTNVPGGIDAPLPIELDEFSTTHILRGKHEKVGESYPGVGHAAGTTEPCHLQLQSMRNTKTRDQVTIVLAKSGPIRPEDYEFIDRKETDKPNSADPFDLPGFATGWFILGRNNPNVEARQKTYEIATGTLTIKSIEGDFIEASVNAIGAYREYSTATGRNEIVHRLPIGLKFRVQVTGLGGAYSDAPYPCIASK